MQSIRTWLIRNSVGEPTNRYIFVRQYIRFEFSALLGRKHLRPRFIYTYIHTTMDTSIHRNESESAMSKTRESFFFVLWRVLINASPNNHIAKPPKTFDPRVMQNTPRLSNVWCTGGVFASRVECSVRHTQKNLHCRSQNLFPNSRRITLHVTHSQPTGIYDIGRTFSHTESQSHCRLTRSHFPHIDLIAMPVDSHQLLSPPAASYVLRKTCREQHTE